LIVAPYSFLYAREFADVGGLSSYGAHFAEGDLMSLFSRHFSRRW